jgi:hypothetical protein
LVAWLSSGSSSSAMGGRSTMVGHDSAATCPRRLSARSWRGV